MKKKKKTLNNKICPLCEKMYKVGRSVCRDCDKKISEIEKRAHSKYRISISRINSLRNIYKQNDILEYLLNNPQLIYKKIGTTDSDGKYTVKEILTMAEKTILLEK